MKTSEYLLTNKDFTLFARLSVAAAIAVICAAANVPESLMAALCIAAVIIAAAELVACVFRDIIKLRFFTERFLMLIALIIILTAGHYPEAVLAAMLFRISEFICAKLRLYALTMAKQAGCEPDTKKKSRMDDFAQRALRLYIPAVIAIALLAAIIPILFTDDTAPRLSLAAIILTVGSPCALTFSIPVCSLFAIYRMSGEGVALCSASAMDMLAATNTVVIDNTEELTADKHIISDVLPVSGLSSHNLLRLAAYAAGSAAHPAAYAIAIAYGEYIDPTYITGSEQISGFGILAQVKGLVISAGNLAMMEKLGLDDAAAALSSDPGAMHIAVNGSYAGCVVITTRINENTKSAIEALDKTGISRTILFSSKNTKDTARTAHTLGIGEYFADCTEYDKARQLEKLLAETFPEETLCYVGTSPTLLEQADTGIALGRRVEGCDAVLTSGNLGSFADVIVTAKRGRSIIAQGLVFAAVLKLVILILTLTGLAPFWLAVFADFGVTVLTLINVMRAGR